MPTRGSIFVLTGAGISAESGIPVFQGTSWRGHSHYELANIAAWEKDPALVWQYYSDRRASVHNANPMRRISLWPSGVKSAAAVSFSARKMWTACMKPQDQKTWSIFMANFLRAGAPLPVGVRHLPTTTVTRRMSYRTALVAR